MVSIFTQIIRGEVPARFVWDDEVCVAFLSIAPVRPGHVLIVPRLEVDEWIDLDPEVFKHLGVVAAIVGRALKRAFDSEDVGMLISGFEIPHAHLHVVAIDDPSELNLARARRADEADLDRAHALVLAALSERSE